jgi:hypothetical protein
MLFYIMTTDLKSFSYIIPMMVQVLVMLCAEFLHAYIVEICHQSIEPIFNHLLHFIIATHSCATQKLLQVCEQVKNHLEPGLDCRKDGKNDPG